MQELFKEPTETKNKRESQIKQLSLIHHEHVFNKIKSCMMSTEAGPRSY